MTFFLGIFLWELLGVVTALAAVGYAYVLWKFQYWKKRDVPYLEPSVPWGNLGNPFTRSVSPGQVLTEFYKKVKPYGWKYVGIYSVTKPQFVAMDLDLVKQVMTKDFHNFVDRGGYTNEKDDPLSCHLFAIGGTKWRNLRTKLSPTFTSGKMKSMFPTLVECGQVLEKYVKDNLREGEGVDIKENLARFSTDIIGSCAFGLECNSFNDPNAPFRIYGRKIFDRSWRDILKFTVMNTFPDLARTLRMVFTPKDVSDFFRNVVADTINYRRKNNVSRNDFLQLIIEIMNNNPAKGEGYVADGKTLTMDEAAAQSFVFFLAGFETSSTTMTFALYEMARHQDIQDRVREEIKTVLAKHDGKITYDAMVEMKYMKQVIDETLRHYAPVPFVTRVSAEDYKIPGEDAILEKGMKVIIPIQGIHMDEDYYPNASKFDPERFSEENKVGRHQYAHLPFGEGPRICIGERFGVMQTKVGLTSILRNFRVTLNKKTQVPLKLARKSFIPTAEGGVWVNLQRV